MENKESKKFHIASVSCTRDNRLLWGRVSSFEENRITLEIRTAETPPSVKDGVELTIVEYGKITLATGKVMNISGCKLNIECDPGCRVVNRRELLRYSCRLKAAFRLSNNSISRWQYGEISDLSPGGAKLVTASNPTGSLLQIIFRLEDSTGKKLSLMDKLDPNSPDPLRDIHLAANVMHSVKQPDGKTILGISFKSLGKEQEKRLEQFIERLQDGYED